MDQANFQPCVPTFSGAYDKSVGSAEPVTQIPGIGIEKCLRRQWPKELETRM